MPPSVGYFFKEKSSKIFENRYFEHFLQKFLQETLFTTIYGCKARLYILKSIMVMGKFIMPEKINNIQLVITKVCKMCFDELPNLF